MTIRAAIGGSGGPEKEAVRVKRGSRGVVGGMLMGAGMVRGVLFERGRGGGGMRVAVERRMRGAR